MGLYLHYVGDPLDGSRWEGLSSEDYYNMTDEERQEFKEYLENLIDVPSGVHLVDEDGKYDKWMYIVSLPPDKLKDYVIEQRIYKKMSCLVEKKYTWTIDELLNETDLNGIPKEKWLEFINNDSYFDYGGNLLSFLF